MSDHFDFIVGYQPLNDHKNDIGGMMFCLIKHPAGSPDAPIAEVRRVVVVNGSGALSARDVLLQLPVQEENKVIDEWKNHVSETSGYGLGMMFHVDGIGDFVCCTGNDAAITKPIFMYTDRDGHHRFIPSPNINNLIVRIKNN